MTVPHPGPKAFPLGDLKEVILQNEPEMHTDEEI